MEVNIPRHLQPTMSNRPTEDFDYQMASSNAAHTSVFANANGVRIEGNFTANINTPSKSSLEVLYQRVSPNAILNIGGRGEDARCHPGTREEVIGLMERWMDGAGNNRIFWMSGPAGGGKTAIMKTVTERAAKRGVPTANFFFFRGDSSRNSAHPVVATLLYQLFRLYPSCLDIAAKLFAESPRILDESMEEQCKLISALFPIIPQSLPAGAPIFILIDGLDECDVEADRSQRDILHAFERLVMKDHSPFRLLVASRQEPRIQMIFNQLPSTACSIFLGKKYSPQNDIRIFVQAEFDTLKVSHPSKGSLPSAWPSSSDVDAIIAKSSGQFIYAATVMRYISHPSIVPTLGLERVMGFVPVVNNSPFANLDSIYTFILGRVSDADAMRDILSMKMVPRSLNLSDMQLLSWYNSRYNSALIESCVSELSAIIKLDEDGYVQFYHASLDDFLRDQARSGPYWIDVDAFRAKVLVMSQQPT
ncbi:hypothetical protein D9619_012522 [Psilocybe cf. subviscida]|uniref:NACHT domain-containing protein n=1 Tax=Psilocybe cf. subviscida TaxID=2480587 RepID=A0A8H5B8W9_9AGAR|nr:hypothetical protein D9619_012522 [Psilocybe cf. subviscida]